MGLDPENNHPIDFPESDRMKVECNGELYNFEDLKEKYQIENYQTDCDSEVIMHVYDKVGIE